MAQKIFQELIIRFSDNSPSYAYGMEFGRLFERFERGEESIQNGGFPVRVENMDVLSQACAYYGYTCTFGKYEDTEGWINFLAIKTASQLS